MTTHLHRKQPVSTQLSSKLQNQQQVARNNLLKIVGGLMYLARQGNALRGHDNKEGNFHQLINYKAEGELMSWLQRHNNFTSPKIQNGVLKVISNTIVHEITKEIQ